MGVLAGAEVRQHASQVLLVEAGRSDPLAGAIAERAEVRCPAACAQEDHALKIKQKRPSARMPTSSVVSQGQSLPPSSVPAIFQQAGPDRPALHAAPTLPPSWCEMAAKDLHPAD